MTVTNAEIMERLIGLENKVDQALAILNKTEMLFDAATDLTDKIMPMVEQFGPMIESILPMIGQMMPMVSVITTPLEYGDSPIKVIGR